MDTGPATAAFIGVALGALAAVCLNVGKGVQKMKVQVLRQGRRALASPHRRDLGIWGVGVALTATATPLYSLALKYAASPSVVSAMTGVGLLGLAAFAMIVLGERLRGPQWIGVVLIVAATSLFGAFHRPAPGDAYPFSRLFSVFGILLAPLAATAFFSWRTRKLWGVGFGALAGSLMATSMVLGELALASAGRSFLGQFATPWVYIALTVGTVALAFSNVAFLRSEALVVVPVFNSAAILYPLAVEGGVRGVAVSPLQVAAIVAIVCGVVLLTAVRSAPVPAPAPEPVGGAA